ncbi:protein NARROW LEAF 1-like isoform X2 [Populus nigra]|uniref:protein NARROW LEAF 1-like isoform X2 n=1 Tax=Populus nigra TaxID=3691 RepID=UPI002B26DD42|nr:protein NARROW LEAF 1-like isoform X2 [Populus nigra]
MDRNRLGLRIHHSGSSQSEESALDLERNYCSHPNLLWSSPSPLQPFTSGGQHSESNAAYFSWPTLSRLNDAAEVRANYFGNLQKGVLPETLGRLPSGQRATTLLELMTIRAFHSKILRRFSLGTAIGFRIRRGDLTDIPAILVFVARKVHRQWLSHVQCLPAALEGPGGVWCDVDVVEFSYYGVPAATPKEQLYTELVDGLRGSDPCIGSGSQVANQETYGTLGAIVKSRTGNRQVGFLTNRHVAVDLDYPNQKMFHPLPPSLGPGVYLGAVERATSFITDELWYGIFAGTNPETFVRADGAFIPFAEDFNMNNVNITVKGVGETFDLEGDSGSLILLTGQDCEKPRPVGIIWGGTANRGRLKLKVGQPPENWTSGVDLGRLLDLLELDIITTNEGLQAAIQDQRNALAQGIDSTVGESSPLDRVPSKEKIEENFEPLNLNIQQVTGEGESQQGQTPLFIGPEFHIEDAVEASPNVEHQFIPSFSGRSPMHDNTPQENPELKNLSALRSDSDEMCFSLHLGEPEPKRRKQSD